MRNKINRVEKNQTTLLFFMQRNHSTGKSLEIWFSSVTSGVRGRGLDSQVPNNATELILQYFP